MCFESDVVVERVGGMVAKCLVVWQCRGVGWLWLWLWWSWICRHNDRGVAACACGGSADSLWGGTELMMSFIYPVLLTSCTLEH